MRGRENQVVKDTGSQHKMLWSSCNAALILLSRFGEPHLPSNQFENGKQCPASKSINNVSFTPFAGHFLKEIIGSQCGIYLLARISKLTKNAKRANMTIFFSSLLFCP